MLPTTPPGYTQPGTILGTFQYMAPEQLEGQEADARTDIFALGAVMYEMVTGKKAFDGKSQASLIAAIMSGEAKAIDDSVAVPAAFSRTLVRCLSKDPDDRWQTARDLLEELRWVAGSASQATEHKTQDKRRHRLAWAWVVAGTASAAAVGVWITELLRTVDPSPVMRFSFQ
jgi:serine/threonine protein kinase